MNIKDFTYNLVMYGFLFNFIASLLPDIIELPPDVVYLLATILIVGFAGVFAKSFIKFLTMKNTLWSNFIMVVVLTTLSLYILQLLMPYFAVNEMHFSGNAFGFIRIEPIDLTPIFSMLVIGIYVAIGNSLLKLLKGDIGE